MVFGEGRIELRAPRNEDADELLRAAGASTELHHPWYRAPATTREWREYVERCQSDSHFGYLIVEAESGSLAGIATVANVIRGSFWSAHLGYAGFAPLQGRGLMSAGISAVLDDAFDS